MGGVRAVDVLGGDPELAVCVAAVVDGDDVGVLEGGDGVGFPDEALPEAGVRGNVGAQDFQGLFAGQAGMLSKIDLAHAAGAELAEDGVSGEGFASPQCHGRILNR